MLGAPLLAGRGALRSGVGRCTLFIPEPLVVSALSAMPSATAVGFSGFAPTELTHDRPTIDAAVIGPGLGEDKKGWRDAYTLIKRCRLPMVIDADGLNALAKGIKTMTRPKDLSKAVLTPHSGEFRTLAKAVGLNADPDNPATRKPAAYELAQRLRTVVVLKGANTVVSDGSDVWQCTCERPVLATAGTGDVLAGVIGGLLAQRAADPAQWNIAAMDIACIAVEAHASAAEVWQKRNRAEAGMLAEELADLIPEQLRPLTQSDGSA